MLGSSIVSMKLASAALTREMVSSETARRLVPNVLDSGKRWILSKLPHHSTTSYYYQRLRQEPSAADDDEASSAEEQALRRRRQQQEEEQDRASAEYLVRHWLEALFAWFQVIVLWHEPRVSLCAISGLLSSFLLLTYFAPRFYATILGALFLYNLNKFWFRHVWPAIRVPPGREREEELRLDVDRWTYLHPQLMSLSELERHFEDALKACRLHLDKLLHMRQHRPLAFAALICSLFTCTAFLGNRITGMSLLFWSLAALMTAPGIYVHLLPEHTKQRLGRALNSLKSIIITTSTVSNDEDLAVSAACSGREDEGKEVEQEEEEEGEEEEEKVEEDGKVSTRHGQPGTSQQQRPAKWAQRGGESVPGGAAGAPVERDLIDLDDDDYVLL